MPECFVPTQYSSVFGSHDKDDYIKIYIRHMTSLNIQRSSMGSAFLSPLYVFNVGGEIIFEQHLGYFD